MVVNNVGQRSDETDLFQYDEFYLSMQFISSDLSISWLQMDLPLWHAVLPLTNKSKVGTMNSILKGPPSVLFSK